MTIYWMLNSHWPSFFGNIFDYYLRPGGAYYGAKKGLRPLSVGFRRLCDGGPQPGQHHRGQPDADRPAGLRVRVRVYDLQGRVRDDRTADRVDVASGGARASR